MCIDQIDFNGKELKEQRKALASTLRGNLLWPHEKEHLNNLGKFLDLILSADQEVILVDTE